MTLMFRAAKVAVALGLIGPIFIPGMLLVDLFVSGTTDDYSEFCRDVDTPSFVFGAARYCELELQNILEIGLLSYGILAGLIFIPIAAILAAGNLLQRLNRFIN